jgi:hypothetical protein
MKNTLHLLLIISMFVIASMSVYAQVIPPDSLYLGQTPPGNIPKIFNLPLTTGLRPVERIAITSDGREIYYGELNTYPPTIQRVKCLKYLDNHWQGPFDVFDGYASPRLSVNDSTMYIQANINDFSTTYCSKRISTGWSTPVKLINTNQQTHYFQTTGLNNSFLSSNLPASPSQRDICRLVITGSDTLIEGLGAPINTTYDENDLFVADDESYLLFSRNSSTGGGDIYLSFKKENGKWTNPKMFGAPINKPGNSWEYGQFISKDNKYLFFTSGGLSMGTYYTYWVKIDNIIESLKYTNFVPYLNYQIPNQSIQTGQPFNYTISDSTFIDDDGNNTLTYSATLSNGNPLPAWLSFTPDTRTFTGTPTEAINIGVKITATDSANTIVSCTFGINVTITGIKETKKQLPEGINLFQNYPNPFNPSTTIEFAIQKTGRYSLSLYNALGELVKEISDKEYDSGYYKETFNAAGLSSGMYIYRLTGDNANIVRKMVVLR